LRIDGILIEYIALFDIWQYGIGPTVSIKLDRARDPIIGIVKHMGSQAELLEIVFTLYTGGGLSHLLHRRQQEPDQDRDDGNHHQQLNEREPPSARIEA
jgi:hypothetical protein